MEVCHDHHCVDKLMSHCNKLTIKILLHQTHFKVVHRIDLNIGNIGRKVCFESQI